MELQNHLIFRPSFLLFSFLLFSCCTIAQVSVPARLDSFWYHNRFPKPNSVVIEAFLDPVCPDCRDSWKPLKEAVDYYGSRIALVVHTFPLPISGKQGIRGCLRVYKFYRGQQYRARGDWAEFVDAQQRGGENSNTATECLEPEVQRDTQADLAVTFCVSTLKQQDGHNMGVGVAGINCQGEPFFIWLTRETSAGDAALDQAAAIKLMLSNLANRQWRNIEVEIYSRKLLQALMSRTTLDILLFAAMEDIHSLGSLFDSCVFRLIKQQNISFYNELSLSVLTRFYDLEWSKSEGLC